MRLGASKWGGYRLTYNFAVIIPFSILHCIVLLVDRHNPSIASHHFAVVLVTLDTQEVLAGSFDVSPGGSHKNDTGPLILGVIFLGKQKMTLKTQGPWPSKIFECLILVSYSSYTTKLYKKNVGSSVRNAIAWNLALLGQSPPYGSFFDGWNFVYLCIFHKEDPIVTSNI